MNNPFLDYPRRRNVFEDYLNPQPSPQSPDTGWRSSVVDTPEPGYEGRDNRGYLDQIRDAYLQEGPAQSAYKQHLENFPQEEPTSIKRRIGAALVGFGVGGSDGVGAGVKATNEVLDSPYKEAIQQWALKGRGLEDAAKLENDASGRRIQYAREVRGAAHDESEFAQKMREYDLKAGTASNKSYLDQRKLEQAGDAEYGRNLRSDKTLAERGKEFTTGQETTRRGQNISAETARRGQNMSASTARRGQDINEGLGYDRNRISEDKTYTKGSNQGSPTANETRADKQALTDVIRSNPKWRKFIDQTGDPVEGAELDPEYDMFVSQVSQRRKQLLGQSGDVNLPKDTIPTFRIK